MNITSIQHGSLFLTDDYVQALTYNVPAQISAFALLKLPAWSESAMFINAAELGLPAGITSPNDIMPAVFNQYWLNLCAHARRLHADIDYGEDIEDFAEQAFWKTLHRLMPDHSILTLTDYMIAKSDDVLVNTNTVDGNMYMEILLSVNAKLAKQSVELAKYKPTYLQAVSTVPSVETSQVLSGHSLALYDKDKLHYDISDDMCLHARFSDVTDATTEFQYNAVLLYYSLADVEQVAGIYFPEQFVANGDGNYELPLITKRSDTNIGYSINVRYMAGESYSYSAANADMGNAMQLYNAWYKAMSNASLQIDTLSKTVMQQGLDIDKLKSVIGGGFITDMYKQLLIIKQQIATTYKGSVTTNRLLELFTQAKNAQGLLDLTLVMSDLSQAMTSRDIVVNNDIGAYKAGDTVSMGTSITDVLEKILHQRIIAAYAWPTGLLTMDGEKDVRFIPYGTAADVSLQVVLTQNDGGTFALPATLTIISDASQQIYIDSTPFTHTLHIASPADAIQLSAIIAYAEGPVKNGDVDNHVYAGLLKLSGRIIPVYDAYLSSIDMLEELSSIAESSLGVWTKKPSNELDVLYNSSKDYAVIAIPANVSCPVVNVIAGTKDISVKGTAYRVYAVKSRYLSIDTSNLQ